MQFVRTIYWLAQILILSFLVNPFFYCLFFFSKESFCHKLLVSLLKALIENSVSRMIDTTSFCCDNNFHNVSYRSQQKVKQRRFFLEKIYAHEIIIIIVIRLP